MGRGGGMGVTREGWGGGRGERELCKINAKINVGVSYSSCTQYYEEKPMHCIMKVRL